MELKHLDKTEAAKPTRPIRILQFGEGNFLRGFFDWMIDTANERGVTDASVAVVSPRFKTNDSIKVLQEQNGLYHVVLEGIEGGKPKRETTLIRCVADSFSPAQQPDLYERYITSPDLRFVVSNTTEAGITYEEGEDASDLLARTFPAKVTAMLFHRFRHFDGDKTKGLIFICCELIEDNGTLLREHVLRHAAESGLGRDFEEWVNDSCIFCDSLVDRIVSGFPKDDIESINESTGYDDKLVVKGELYHLWVIGGKDADKVKSELPLDRAGLNVHFQPSVKEFRDKKVRILNGSHTGMTPIALQLGCETVLDAFNNAQVNAFINHMVEREVIPMIDGDKDELNQFAAGILERFYNPYIRHMLTSIALNSLSKWETRNLPTALDFHKRTGRLADHELFTFAALLTLYAHDSGFGPNDDEGKLRAIQNNWDSTDIPGSVASIVGADIFTRDFEALMPGFCDKVAGYVTDIRTNSMQRALDHFLAEH